MPSVQETAVSGTPTSMPASSTRPRSAPERTIAGARRRYRFGFDIGGTFTDFVLMDVESGRLATYKTLTTPASPAEAALGGWAHLLGETGISADRVEASVHGTTLITNALIERSGARTG